MTRRGLRLHVAALLSSAALVAVVTGAIVGLRSFAPALSLGVLYLFAVLPVALVFGTPYAVLVSVAAMLAFNFFFLPPYHTLALRDSENWVALAVYLVTAVVVGELAARSRRRAAYAQQREREAAFLAEVSAALLEAEGVRDPLKQLAARTAEVLGVRRGRIELESVRRPESGEAAADLRAARRHVGRLSFEAGDEPGRKVLGRVVSPLASLLAVALDRERLARTAVEAEALRRSDAIKTAVLRSVSHDLRSPLTAIRAAAEGLERADLDLDARDRAELVDAIRAEAVRLERVVTNLIDLSRLEAGAARPRPEVWSADELVARSLEPLGAAAERVVVQLPADPPAALVDAVQIERALVNLIENALKFSSSADPVTVMVRRDDCGDRGGSTGSRCNPPAGSGDPRPDPPGRKRHRRRPGAPPLDLGPDPRAVSRRRRAREGRSARRRRGRLRDEAVRDGRTARPAPRCAASRRPVDRAGAPHRRSRRRPGTPCRDDRRPRGDADADRVRPPPLLRPERGEAAHASDDPARGVGPGVRRRVALPARVRVAAAPEDRARPGAAPLHPHGDRRRLPARESARLTAILRTS